MSFVLRVSVLLGFAATASALLAAQDHQHPAGERLGTVHFETTCAATARAPFDHAMALLHSFEFGPAIDGFTASLKEDPACGMAHWGIAIARWTNPFAPSIRSAAQLQSGLAAITEARRAGLKTERERAYVDAAAKLYEDTGTTDQRTRVVAYEQAMSRLAAAYPDDREASIFWALSLTAAALPGDKTYANQLKAGAILEKLYAVEPEHPGITHYIIHSYDVPALADRALAAARRYATIAPAAPHALHMPSHTFTRVGAWAESIETNIASAAAARRAGALAEELHAMDYMAYAYLQTGQDKAVQALFPRMGEISAAFDPSVVAGAAPGSAGVFALAAIPSRWVLERRDWSAAAKLTPTPSKFPYTDAIMHFARALGAAHTGAMVDARRSLTTLQEIRDRLAQSNETYWAEQVAIQHAIGSAFVMLAEGKTADAVAAMRTAAAREDATEKSAVTPGPIAPARELLGEMLLEAKEPAAALKEFEASLKKEPNRFRSVYGAARSAAQAGDRDAARAHFSHLLKICEHADSPGRAELAEARQSVAATSLQYSSPEGVEYRSLAETEAIGTARAALAADPRNIARIIDLGVAESGARQFREAIATFTRGLAIEPDNALLLRWRGHRYLSIRDFDRAFADLTRGAALDGTIYGIWYHLGVVQYLRGDFAAAATSFAKAQPIAPDAGELAGSTDWLWMSLSRAGRGTDAQAMLDRRPDSKPVTNAYTRRLQLYRGEIGPEAVLTPADTDDVQVATLAYGLGNWYVIHNDKTQARKWFERSIQSGGWPAFGFIVSEVELRRLK